MCTDTNSQYLQLSRVCLPSAVQTCISARVHRGPLRRRFHLEQFFRSSSPDVTRQPQTSQLRPRQHPQLKSPYDRSYFFCRSGSRRTRPWTGVSREPVIVCVTSGGCSLVSNACPVAVAETLLPSQLVLIRTGWKGLVSPGGADVLSSLLCFIHLQTELGHKHRDEEATRLSFGGGTEELLVVKPHLRPVENFHLSVRKNFSPWMFHTALKRL